MTYKTNEELVKARLAFLDETVEFYSVNPIERRSILPGVSMFCAYRGANDTACAIGRHIPDDKYQLSMEKKSFTAEFLNRFPNKF